MQSQTRQPLFSFQVFNAPQTPNLSQRRIIARAQEDIDDILAAIKTVCRDDSEARRSGFLVISGENGIGKTTLIGQLLREPEHGQFFLKDCQLRQAFWFNCYQWRHYQQEVDEDHFKCAISKLIAPVKEAKERPATIFVFDDVYHLSLIEIMRKEIVQGLFMPCVAITRTRECQAMQLASQWQHLVNHWHELPRFSNEQLSQMFASVAKELPIDDDDPSFLRELVDKCDGIPRPTSELQLLRQGPPSLKAPDTIVVLPVPLSTSELSERFILRSNTDLEQQHAKLLTAFSYSELKRNMEKKSKTTLGFAPGEHSGEQLQKSHTTVMPVHQAEPLKLLNVPQFRHVGGAYYARQSEEERVLQSIKRASLFSSSGNTDNVAVIAISGMGGVGKTMLVSHVLSDRRYQAGVLQRYCKIDGVVWIDCSGSSTCTDDGLKKSVEENVVKITTEKPKNGDNDDSNFFVTTTRNRANRLLIVLDHYGQQNHDSVVEYVKQTAIKNNSSCIVIVIFAANVQIQQSATPQSLIIDKMADWQLVDMFETVYNLKDRLNVRHQLLALANSKLCHGLPLIASFVATQLNQHNLDKGTYTKLLSFAGLSKKPTSTTSQDSAFKTSVQTVVTKMFEEALKTLHGSDVPVYFNTFLLFKPGEAISVENDLAFLWQRRGKGGVEIAEKICHKLQELALITRHSVNEDSTTSFIQLHPLVFESAFQHLTATTSTFTSSTSLSKVRLGILLNLLVAKGMTFVQFIDSAMKQQRMFTIDKLLQLINPQDIAQVSASEVGILFSLNTGDNCDEDAGEIAADNQGWTGLMLAARHGHFDLMRYQILSVKKWQDHALLSRYITAQESDKGMSALMLAVRHSHFEAARLLLSFDYGLPNNHTLVDAMMSSMNQDGETPLMIIVQQPLTGHNVEILRLLAGKCNSEVLKLQNITTGDTALNVAAAFNNLTALRIIAATAAFNEDVQAVMTLQNLMGDTPLLSAIRMQNPVNLDMLRWLCDRCSDMLRYRDYQAHSSLHLINNQPCALYLYEKWPEAIQLQDRIGRTPLMSAIEKNVDKTGIDLIRFYAANSQAEIIKLAAPTTGETALMLAVDGRQLGTVKVLLQVVNQRNPATMSVVVQQRDQSGRNVLERAIHLYIDDKCTQTFCNRYQHQTEMVIIKVLLEVLNKNRAENGEALNAMYGKLKVAIEEKMSNRRRHHRGHLVFLEDLLKLFESPMASYSRTSLLDEEEFGKTKGDGGRKMHDAAIQDEATTSATDGAEVPAKQIEPKNVRILIEPAIWKV